MKIRNSLQISLFFFSLPLLQRVLLPGKALPFLLHLMYHQSWLLSLHLMYHLQYRYWMIHCWKNHYYLIRYSHCRCYFRHLFIGSVIIVFLVIILIAVVLLIIIFCFQGCSCFFYSLYCCINLILSCIWILKNCICRIDCWLKSCKWCFCILVCCSDNFCCLWTPAFSSSSFTTGAFFSSSAAFAAFTASTCASTSAWVALSQPELYWLHQLLSEELRWILLYTYLSGLLHPLLLSLQVSVQICLPSLSVLQS